MTGALFHLGRFCVRRRWIVVAIWLVVVIALAVWARSAGTDVNDNLTLPGSDSQDATSLLEERFPSQANGTNPVVLRAPDGAKLSASKYKAPVDDTVSRTQEGPGRPRRDQPAVEQGLVAAHEGREHRLHRAEPAPELRATSRRTTRSGSSRWPTPRERRASRSGFGGYLGQKVSKPETHLSEVIGLGMAVIVLLVTFGTVVAMGLPIFTAIVGLVSGLSIITLLSHVAEVPTVAPTLATMIGLGVGIDYALFIVTRHLEQRRDGMQTYESIARASATSGGAVVFAGCTVMVALLSLAVVQHPARHDARVHVGAGRRGRGPCRHHAAAGRCWRSSATGSTSCALPLPHAQGRRPSARLAALGRVRRAPSAAVLRSSRSSILVALALPALDLYLGQQDNGALPEEHRRAAGLRRPDLGLRRRGRTDRC